MHMCVSWLILEVREQLGQFSLPTVRVLGIKFRSWSGGAFSSWASSLAGDYYFYGLEQPDELRVLGLPLLDGNS